MGYPQNVLFIGAGASFGARQSPTHKIAPPLGLELLRFLRANIDDLRNEIWASRHVGAVGILEKADGILRRQRCCESFEEYLARLDDADDRELVHRTLQIAFSDLTEIGLDIGFRSTTDSYDFLASVLQINPQDWIVISLNYDLLFEEALARNDISYDYPYFSFASGKEERKAHIRVFKPHGSINFLAHSDHNFSFGEQSADYGKPIRYYDDRHGNLRPRYPTCFAVQPGDVIHYAYQPDIHPVIANYTAGKDSDVNQPDLLDVRKKAIQVAQRAEHLLMIGVKPILDQIDDPFCAELLGLNFSRVTYVGRDAGDGDQIRRRFAHAELHLNGLDANIEFLRYMRFP